MKVLIVDDEKHVRDAIRLLGEWDEHQITEIYEAENGEEATELILSKRPEIIFTDMKMPKMDGIQLLQWTKEQQVTSKVIVVTGYDDYHYMRSAIHYGSADYLLKPIDPDILNQTLATAVHDWKQAEANRKQQETTAQLVNKMKDVYRDRKLTQLLNQDHENKNDRYYEEFGFHHSHTYQIALMRVSGKTVEAFAGDRDLAYFTILNVINEVVLASNCGIGFRYLSEKGEIVIMFWEQFDKLEANLSHIYRTLKKVMNISCPIAVGGQVEDRASLFDSYVQAKHILRNANVLEDKPTRVYLKVDTPVLPLKNVMDYAASIEVAVQSGRVEAFGDLIEQIEADMIPVASGKKITGYRQLVHLENEYLVLSNRWFQVYQIHLKVNEQVEERVDAYFNEDGQFQLDAFKARKKREIEMFLKKVKRRSRRKQSNIIHEIEAFLHANFDRDVKLQEISEHFYISREYISRRFKQEFNVTISDYILNIRMRKAKALLENNDLKIYEIANMIGYQDDKYFRKVFKKIEGITPNEYRAKVESGK